VTDRAEPKLPRRTLAAFVAALAMLLPACSSEPSSDEPRSEGPLVVPPEHGWARTWPAGRVFTDGLEVLKTKGDAVATIESVELVGADNMKLVGTLLAPPPRNYAAEGFIKAWPPRMPGLFERSTLVPAVGATVGPGAGAEDMGWELLLGIEATGDGIASRDGVMITYSVASVRYQATLPARAVVCTDPKLEVKGSCPSGT
jgi:hypothetical protein